MIKWHEFSTRQQLDGALAATVARGLKTDIAERGSASAAFSGGSTPRGMLSALSKEALTWSSVGITLVDERWVDAKHADSNARLLADTLLQNRAAAASFLPLFSANCEAEQGAVIAAQRLKALYRPFSAVILGMGDDGHTASWFPEATNLSALTDPDQTQRLLSTDPVLAPHQRVTLTLPAVLDTRLLVLHITGTDKRLVLDQALAQDLPVARLLEQQQQPLHIYWAP